MICRLFAFLAFLHFTPFYAVVSGVIRGVLLLFSNTPEIKQKMLFIVDLNSWRFSDQNNILLSHLLFLRERSRLSW